jgi:hypothetical protein|tara:strand:+ start:7355 stop:8137 length:783 start_codon:yes stop_codon:yes gene_type:complete
MVKNAIFQFFLPSNGIGKLKHYRILEDDNPPDWGLRSVNYFEKYAERHNADYFFFTEKSINSTSNYFEKCRIYLDGMFDQYDKVLYADIDVIPKNMEASVFDIDVIDVAGWPEWSYPKLKRSIPWNASKPLRDRYNHFGSKIVKAKTVPSSTIRMINTGVVLWSKKARLFARENFDSYEDWFQFRNSQLDKKWGGIAGHSSHCLDQPFFNAMWSKYDMDVLETSHIWNRFPTMDEDHPCNFAHYVNDHRYNITKQFEKLK